LGLDVVDFMNLEFVNGVQNIRPCILLREQSISVINGFMSYGVNSTSNGIEIAAQAVYVCMYVWCLITLGRVVKWTLPERKDQKDPNLDLEKRYIYKSRFVYCTYVLFLCKVSRTLFEGSVEI